MVTVNNLFIHLFNDPPPWSCVAGNIAISVHDAANWWWDIFHTRLVNYTTLETMMNSIPLSQGWSPGP